MTTHAVETWIELHHSACVQVEYTPRKGRGYWLSWSPRLRHGPFRSKPAAILAASHALGLRGVDCDWRRDIGQPRFYWLPRALKGARCH